MDSKEQIELMARKYKDEMLRMYKSNKQNVKTSVNTTAEQPENISPPKLERSEMPKRPAISSPTEVTKPKSERVMTNATPKFLPPEEIMREEFGAPQDNIVPERSDENEPQNFQGNYNSEEFSDLNDALEPRYKGEEGDSPDESGVGYIKAEVTTGSGAVPIGNAVVLITKKVNGKNYLLKMLITDESGSTETVALPAPNASFSETPDPSEKPFADYYISAYADGFYAENDMEVPVFSGVKSIQPIALIPKASDDSRFML